jgi:hypothetical protein
MLLSTLGFLVLVQLTYRIVLFIILKLLVFERKYAHKFFSKLL